MRLKPSQAEYPSLLLATAVPCISLVVLWGLVTLVFDSVDWVWHYRAAALIATALICLMLGTSAWGFVRVAKAAKRADDHGESSFFVYGSLALLVACALGTTGDFAVGAKVWFSSLWTWVKDVDDRPEIFLTEQHDRLVVRGSFGLGTTKAVDAALADAPSIRLVELDSPGGYAIEGLGLAKVLEARQVDTLVLHRCASACITAFAAGERRILGSTAWLGFHAASGARRKGKLDLDEAHAKFLESRGVATWLTNYERATPNDDIWIPGPAELLASGLVTSIQGPSVSTFR